MLLKGMSLRGAVLKDFVSSLLDVDRGLIPQQRIVFFFFMIWKLQVGLGEKLIELIN